MSLKEGLNQEFDIGLKHSAISNMHLTTTICNSWMKM